MRVVGITDIGLHRKRNEDQFFIDEDRRIFVVCDGMGGHKGGDVASRLAVETIQENLVFSVADQIIPSLQSVAKLANQIIWEKGQSDEALYEMGTTLTVAVIHDGSIVVAHVGDSSLYLFKEDQLIKVTRDHTLAQQMFSDGVLKREDMRSNVYNHVLTRAVGVESQVELDIYQEEIQTGDWVLMCTDGLTDLVEDDAIRELIKAANDPQKAAQELLNLALSKGGYDNITIVLLRV
jgi:serine/threonine protein phosphatase PrpC